jgi:hypothetical protein
MGWQRWRRRLLEQTRALVIVFAQTCYGILHRADYSLVPPGSGTPQAILAKSRLAAHGLILYPNLSRSSAIHVTLGLSLGYNGV